jgi:hypothetical protein
MPEPAPHECTCGCVLVLTDGQHNEGCCCRVKAEPVCHDTPMTWWELVNDWVCDPCGRVGVASDCTCGCPKPEPTGGSDA